MRNENGAQVDTSAWKMKAKLLAIAVSRTQCTATPPLTTMGAALPQSKKACLEPHQLSRQALLCSDEKMQPT